MNLDDAHVLVTGGSKGLGAALAHEFVRRGARMTLIARRSAELDTVARQTEAAVLPLDLSDLATLKETVARAEEGNGPLDVLVNNAASLRIGPFHSLSEDELQLQLFTNLLAPMELSRQVLPGMLSRGRGVIVNVSSLSTNISVRNTACYSVSKSGLSKFTVDLQTELKDSGVRALLVALGAVGGTPMIRQFENDAATAGATRRFKIFATAPEEVARRIAHAVVRERRRSLVIPRVASPLVSTQLIPIRLASRVVAS